MSVDVKLGGNTITGVSSVKLESATTPGTYETFELGGSGDNLIIAVGNMPSIHLLDATATISGVIKVEGE